MESSKTMTPLPKEFIAMVLKGRRQQKTAVIMFLRLPILWMVFVSLQPTFEGRIAALTQVAKEIDNFLSTISAISVQTNLLSLNASIEAARAGEHEPGFSSSCAKVKSCPTPAN